MATTFAKEKISTFHTRMVFKNGEFEEVVEDVYVDSFTENGLALHVVFGSAKVYWNLTHVRSGRKLTIKTKKFLRVPDAKKWLEYVSSLRDWNTSYQATLQDSERPIQTLLTIIDNYLDDRSNEEDKDED